MGVEQVDGGRRLRPQVDLVGQRALDQEIDLVVADVGVDGHEEVARRRDGQAAVPACSRQRLGRGGVTDVHRQVALLGRRGHVARQLDRIDAAEVALDLGLDSQGETAEERLAVEHPLADFLPLLDVARLAQRPQEIVGVDRLVGVGDGHRASSFDQQAQELLVDSDRPVERRLVEAIGVEVHRLAGRGGEVGPEVGVAEDEDLQPHEVVERLGREVVGLGADVVHVAGVAETEAGDAAVLHRHDARAGQEAAGGAQLVLVLGHDEVAPRPVRAQQRRQMGGQPQAVLTQRQPFVGQFQQLAHPPR